MQNPESVKRTIYVGNLDEQVTTELLHSAFIPFGDILNINLPFDEYSRKHRAFAFIEFEEIEDAADAVDNMHQSEILGKTISVSIAQSNNALNKD